MSNFKTLGFCLFATSLLFTACDDDDPIMENEEEVITTMSIALSGTDGSTIPAVMTLRDLDGDGGNPPIISGASLKANTTYTYDITILNEQETPVDDITLEVRDEAADHQIFFRSQGGLNVTTTYSLDATELDGNGRPIGLRGSLTTGAASTGNLTVTLRHEPNKGADGVAAGNIANAGGETDIEAVFPVTVQ